MRSGKTRNTAYTLSADIAIRVSWLGALPRFLRASSRTTVYRFLPLLLGVKQCFDIAIVWASSMQITWKTIPAGTPTVSDQDSPAVSKPEQILLSDDERLRIERALSLITWRAVLLISREGCQMGKFQRFYYAHAIPCSKWPG